MPRYLSLFKYNAEGRKGLMKEKAAAREAALKLTIESAGGRLELVNWAAPGSEYSGISIGEFPDAGSCAAVFGLIEATGMFTRAAHPCPQSDCDVARYARLALQRDQASGRAHNTGHPC